MNKIWKHVKDHTWGLIFLSISKDQRKVSLNVQHFGSNLGSFLFIHLLLFHFCLQKAASVSELKWSNSTCINLGMFSHMLCLMV